MESEAGVRIRVEQVDSVDVHVDAIRKELAIRAYEKYLERGQEPGGELEDWLSAEQEMFVKANVLEPHIENNQIIVEIVLQSTEPQKLSVFVAPYEMLLLGSSADQERRIFETVSFQREILPSQTEAEFVLDTLFVVASIRSDREVYQAA
jgi:hypothetical protein